MIDHFSICVKNLPVSTAFYRKTLEPLSYKLSFDNDYAVSFGESRGVILLEIFGCRVVKQIPDTLLFMQRRVRS